MSTTVSTPDAPASLTLPAAVMEQLIGAGLNSPAGQLILATILNLHPDVKAAVEAQGGRCHVQAGAGVLAAGHASPPDQS